MTAKSTKKRTPECEDCGTVRNVHYRIDPYNYEINDKIVYRWLCDNCYNDRKDEI